MSEIINIISSEQWRVSSMVDSGQDETADFFGYTFSFNSNGSLVATGSSNTLTGTWSLSNSSSSSSSDDDSNDDSDVDFIISFPVPDDHDFDDLNDDWDVVSYSSNEIRLIDISGGNGGTDTLVFTKN
ncbi:hypothetical protein J4050_09335 [Winogradskyella sp. DF17]|uniref:Uncharacterized protein n=1 Tax=Winogradskyella pelagia TaxID=2819984 RepID=A0ABS3T5E1_9FLAO|nr:hypothetical protein [Winogradskyella sp. DF17]